MILNLLVTVLIVICVYAIFFKDDTEDFFGSRQVEKHLPFLVDGCLKGVYPSHFYVFDGYSVSDYGESFYYLTPLKMEDEEGFIAINNNFIIYSDKMKDSLGMIPEEFDIHDNNLWIKYNNHSK